MDEYETLNHTTWDCKQHCGGGFVHQLMEARDERRLLKLQRDLASVKLLIIDELGYVPLFTTGAELLFEVFSQ